MIQLPDFCTIEISISWTVNDTVLSALFEKLITAAEQSRELTGEPQRYGQ